MRVSRVQSGTTTTANFRPRTSSVKRCVAQVKEEDEIQGEEEPLTYSSSKTELIHNNQKDITAFLDQFQTRAPHRFSDRELFALTLLDPRSLNHEEEHISIAKLPVLLANKLNIRKVDVTALHESVKYFVEHAGSVNEGEFSGEKGGQALITWHLDQLSIGHTRANMYHDFCLTLMPLLVVNVKSETIFSRHKRAMGKDRTSTRTKVINSECVLQDDPRLDGKLQDINLGLFEKVMAQLVHTGDSKLQEKHLLELQQ
jgi:hypothetical protein